MARNELTYISDTDIELNCGFFRAPRAFCNDKRLTASAKSIFNLIFSYSNPKTGSAYCERTHDGFARELNLSAASVTRGIKCIRGIKDGDGEQLLQQVKQSTYRIDKNKISGKCYYIEKCLINLAFKFPGGEMRRLSQNEITVASFIISNYKYSPDKKAGVKASYADIGGAVGLCEKTVAACLANLLKCRLLFRGNGEKGLNGFKKSVYHPNSAFLDRIDRARAEKAKKRKKVLRRTDAEAEPKQTMHEREAYYSGLRHKAEAKAEENLAAANKDQDYKTAKAELIDIALQRGKYAAIGDKEYKAASARWERALAGALLKLGLTDDDLRPKYRCCKCNDTGWDNRTGKLCDCYPNEEV